MKSSITRLVTGALVARFARAEVPGFDISITPSRGYISEADTRADEFAIFKISLGTEETILGGKSLFEDALGGRMVRGAYHIARPDLGPGTNQYYVFSDAGGGWTPRTNTLPGTLWLEDVPGHRMPPCYGLDPEEMVSWIGDFVGTYRQDNANRPIIYTTLRWWTDCTGNSRDFSNRYPLWLGGGGPDEGVLPGGWERATFRRLDEKHSQGGARDLFLGTRDELWALANEPPQE